MIGRTLSHFKITAKLGEGGMGEVYRARDEKLERDVALKVLPRDLASSQDRLERFRREAKALAALNHPNIASIYALETADPGDGTGVVEFLVIELVEGDTLDALIPEAGLPLDRLLAFATAIADSLESAHIRGIVHRDLKPANIMVAREGERLKVLDFGLAKLTDSTTPPGLSELPTEALTQEGMVLGTPHYMSPEQAKGHAVDHRSDIFSLGVVIFEMATGQRPFHGETAIELLSSVLKDTPRSIRELRPQLPPEVGRIVDRCLGKAPADRYQVIREVLVDLGELAGASAVMGEGVTAELPAFRELPDESSMASPSRSTFVARSRERKRIGEMLTAASQGRGGLVLLAGEPGVGKTRLATEALAEGKRRGMLALVGHSYEDEAVPFVMVSEVLEGMVRRVPPEDLRRWLGSDSAELSRLLPELRQLWPDIPETQDLPPELQQRHLFKSVAEFLLRTSREVPVAILLDDVQWADESSLRLLEHVASRLSDARILILATYRDVDADIGKPFQRSMGTLVRQRLAERMRVEAFDESAVGEILSALGGSSPPAPLVAAIHEATEGNAFFVEEIYRHLSEEELLLDKSGDWLQDIDIERLDVPEGVRLVVARRLERLADSTRSVLSFASILGLRFSIPVLEAVVGDGGAMLEAVEEAEAAQLLRPVRGGRELRYEFVHALARQTLSSALSPLRRQRMHLTVADALEHQVGSAGHRAADIAHHLVEAGGGDPDRTARWLGKAGTEAASAAAAEEAVHYFDAALAMLGEDRTRAWAELTHRRGSALLSLGRRPEFIDALTASFEAYESLGLGEAGAAVVSELSYMLVWNAQPADAQVLIDRGLELAGGGSSPSGSRLLSARGLAHGMASEPVEAEASHRGAVGMARSLGDDALLAEVLQNQAIDGWFRLNGAILEEAGHEGAAINRRLGKEWSLGHCLWMEQAGLVWQGRYADAERINKELILLAERNEDVGSLAICAMMNCLIEQARGDLEESSHQMRRSIDLFNAGGFPWGWISEGHYSVNALLVGDYDKARTAFELAGANAIPGIVWSGADNCYLLSGKARMGDSDTLALYESLRPEIPQQGQAKSSGPAMLLMGAIEALVLIGEDAEAATLYPAMRDIVDEGASVKNFTYGFHERFAGMAAAAAGDWAAAEGHFTKGLELARALDHRVEQARVRYWFARMLLGRGADSDRKRAGDLLREARSASQSIGLHGLIEQIDRLG